MTDVAQEIEPFDLAEFLAFTREALRARGRTQPICDFCGVDPKKLRKRRNAETQWIYPSRDFMTAGTQYTGKAWLACATCAPIIDRGDLDELYSRALRTGAIERVPSAAAAQVMRNVIIDAWQKFIANRTGPAIPFPRPWHPEEK